MKANNDSYIVWSALIVSNTITCPSSFNLSNSNLEHPSSYTNNNKQIIKIYQLLGSDSGKKEAFFFVGTDDIKHVFIAFDCFIIMIINLMQKIQFNWFIKLSTTANTS